MVSIHSNLLRKNLDIKDSIYRIKEVQINHVKGWLEFPIEDLFILHRILYTRLYCNSTASNSLKMRKHTQTQTYKPAASDPSEQHTQHTHITRIYFCPRLHHIIEPNFLQIQKKYWTF